MKTKTIFRLLTAAGATIVLYSCSSGKHNDENKKTEDVPAPATEMAMKEVSNDTVGFTILLPEGAKMLPVNKGGQEGNIYSCNIWLKLDGTNLNPIVMHFDNFLVGSLDDAAKNMYGKMLKEKKAIGNDYLLISKPDSTQMESIMYYAKGPKDYLCFSGDCPVSAEAVFVKMASSLKAK